MGLRGTPSQKSYDHGVIKTISYILLLLFVAASTTTTNNNSNKNSFVANALPDFLVHRRNKRYTPLLFFKVHKGTDKACDEMEKVVKQVEKELNVRVERIDVEREPGADGLLGEIAMARSAPYLYHRESLQAIWVERASKPTATSTTAAAGTDKSASAEAETLLEPIDKARVRAWAKGRLVPPIKKQKKVALKSRNADNATGDIQDEAIDATLTHMQRSGREAIKKRTAELGEKMKQKQKLK